MSCYICGGEKHSVEHAPAKCFFPTDKRNNLITVDSCEEHNEATSKDDEYVRNIIAMSISNNNVALNHFLEKCMKSFLRSPALLKITTENNKRVYYKDNQDEDKEIKPTYAFGIDRNRIDLVMKKIAYAIYLHKYEHRWNRELHTGTEHLRTEEMTADDMGLLIQGTKKLISDIPFEGTNPEVFQYAFLPTDSEDDNDQVLLMKFYEGFEMWIFPKNDSEGPKI
jgi:hydroxylamine reductase (hybrid-cluster protein)